MMGSGEILIILVVILILFGGKRLPEFAQSLGKGIREFKKACYGEEEPSSSTIQSEPVNSMESKSITLPVETLKNATNESSQDHS